MTKFPSSRITASALVVFGIEDARVVDQTVSVRVFSRTRLPSDNNSSFDESRMLEGLSLFATQTIVLSAKFLYHIPR
ncbi:hypothetical protein OIU77_018432 [Salix suchowensis]|uniref:Uncharacterized protein n=1 Tax=Salix suchowensis TaxID=1278906 RepID=A0ABQ9CCK3_9ROSI|nr:hypothetical protein OIU77_018432 [Salix suchowensis]